VSNLRKFCRFVLTENVRIEKMGLPFSSEPRSPTAMRTVVRAYPYVRGSGLAMILLLTGCLGHNAIVFPWSQSQTPPGQPSHESKLEHVTTASFEDRVLKCDKPVLVDFYAEWCNPCKRLGPVLEDFAREQADVRVVKINVDENPELAKRYEVTAMPTLVSIRGGQVKSRSVGLVTKEKLKEMTTL
jgi:thioredoxin 1